jgi:pyruvate,water dikinase
VVVQKMVHARTSGVIFTIEPVTGDPERLAIDACEGLGEALVSGRVTPEHYELRRRDLSIVKREHRAGHLRKSELRAVAECALAIEREYDSPQDIEWSIDVDGHLHILQSRPVTTAPEAKQWKSPVPRAIWVRYGGGGLVEYLPGAVSPLFATAQLPRIVRLLDAQCPEMGVITPPPGGTVINGHFYSRQDYRLGPRAVMLPVNYWRAGKKGAPRWKNEVLPAQIAARIELERFDLERATEPELLTQLERILDFNATAWDNAVRASRSWVVGEPVFLRIFQWFVKPIAGGDAVAFLRGFDSQVLAAERAQHALVEAATADPEIRAILESCEPAAALIRLRESTQGQQWIGQLLAYCSRFGHVTPSLDYLVPAPADDPSKVIVSIRGRLNLACSDPLQRFQQMARERWEAEHDIARKLHGKPLRRALFNRFLRRAQAGAAIREDVFFYALAGWPLARRTILALGKRLERRGAISSERDIFFLEWDEIAAIVTGSEEDCVARASHRIAVFNQQEKLSPPPVIPFGGPPRTVSRRIKSLVKRFVMGSRRDRGRDFLRGAPVSPGRATGPARILSSTADLSRLKTGDIVVTRAATPEWTPTFAIAAALVTDTGGPLSHSSIIAREFGIPAVMGAASATQRIVEGQFITVDGGEGLIRLHSSKEEV